MTANLRFRPYNDEAKDFLYNLLFCDDRDLFQPRDGKPPTGPWAEILAARPDAKALRSIASDEHEEGRIRALAFNRLRETGAVVPARILLGTIVEVAMPGGLDALAAYSDGGARHLNHSGAVSIVEGNPSPKIKARVAAVMDASRPVVEKIGPWDKPRRPPPTGDNARLTFLVSDGLYFGEGPFGTLAKEPMSAPLVQAATQLLVAIVDINGQRAR